MIKVLVEMETRPQQNVASDCRSQGTPPPQGHTPGTGPLGVLQLLQADSGTCHPHSKCWLLGA